MTAYEIIVVYASLWLAWGFLVGVVPRPSRKYVGAARSMPYLSISTGALVPIVVLAFVARYTHWIPTRVNEMLSLMTPLLALLFLVQQLRRLSARQGSAGNPPEPAAPSHSTITNHEHTNDVCHPNVSITRRGRDNRIV